MTSNFHFNNLKSDDNTKNEGNIYLNLYDNGVFTYTFAHYAPFGTMGNYYIDGNSIILNTWFNTGSSAELDVAKGSKTLTINADGTITDNNVKIKIIHDKIHAV